MHQNEYADTAERWKVALLVRRAKRMGFRRDELDDVQQTVVLKMADFKFDPEKANGASETTALTGMIDRQLRTMRRAKLRYRRRLDQMRAESGCADDQHATNEELQPSYEEPTALVCDVREAVAGLGPRDRQLCTALAAGQSVDEIAKGLGCGWHTVQRRIARIREHFCRIGLDDWIGN